MVIVEYTQPKLISASIYRDTGEFSCVITRHYVAANTVKLGELSITIQIPKLELHSVRTDADQKHGFYPLACPDSGPHSV